MTSELREIVKTLRSLRKDLCPEIPESLIVQIAEIEAENIEDRAEARRLITEAIESYLEGR